MNIDFDNKNQVSSNNGTAWGEPTQQHYTSALARQPTENGSESSVKRWQSMVYSHPRSPEGAQEDKRSSEAGKKFKWVADDTARGGYWKTWQQPKTVHDEVVGRKRIDNAPSDLSYQYINTNSTPNTSSTLDVDRKCRKLPSTSQAPSYGGSNTWMNQPLVEIPFWEKREEDQPSQVSSSTLGHQHQSDQTPSASLLKSGPSFTGSHSPLLVDVVEQPQHQQSSRASQAPLATPPNLGSILPSVIIPTSPMEQANATQSMQPDTWKTDDELWHNINKSITPVHATDTISSSSDNSSSSSTDNKSKSSPYMDWISNEYSQLQAAPPPSPDSDHFHAAETPSSPAPSQQIQEHSSNSWKSPATRTRYPPASEYQWPHDATTAGLPTQPTRSHNPVVIGISLELENGRKTKIGIRMMDDPHILALSICKAHSITKPSIQKGVVELLSQQKSHAMQRYTR